MTIELFHTGLIQGLILSMIAFGIMIVFRLLDLPDLTAEGAYPLGGAVFAVLLTHGIQPIFAMLFAALAGGLMALGTAHVIMKLKVNSLLAGIILSTMIYSVNLRIMDKPNIHLFQADVGDYGVMVLGMLLLSCAIPFALFLYTDLGLKFRAIGLNRKFAINNKISITKYTSFGFIIAGMMFGLAGSVVVQVQQFMDIGMGVGIVIHALASLMMGEAMIGRNTLIRQLMAPIIGALVYQQIQGIVLALGLAPSDLKFFTGGIVLCVLYTQKLRMLA